MNSTTTTSTAGTFSSETSGTKTADFGMAAVVTIGKPAPETARGSARRGWKPIDAVVHWERW